MNWINSMKEELHQFEKGKVWYLVPKPIDRTFIGTLLVYKNKTSEHGNTIRNKERLVVQGYNQEEEIHYNETFAPVVRIEEIKILIAFSSYI